MVHDGGRRIRQQGGQPARGRQTVQWLPSDYQILLNGHLYLNHSETGGWNLGQWIRETVRAWSEVPWEDLDPDEDPRLLCELTEWHPRRAVADRGYGPGRTLFLVDADSSAPWLLVDDGGWARYRHELRSTPVRESCTGFL